ncbi:MAG: glycoside hydrolase family 26 protein [Bacteroidales bacterium]|nr:glycoside hydrolase family 26 protein [Bacteroidales bacterium]
MKNYLPIALAALALASCGKKQQAEPEPLTPAQTLIERLQGFQDKGIIAFGHHDDTAYGYRWAYVADSSDVKNVTGDYPAIMNWDLGLIEWNCAKELDSVPFDFIRQEAAKQHARGGINSFSWHPRNPVTKGDSWDVSDTTVMAQVMAPGALNDTLNVWIGRAADFIGSLKDADGNPIPVIFRPWHEQTGQWFWWGLPNGSPELYKDLWKQTRQVFDEKGINNVVWAFSPDKSNCETMEQYMASYPGDEYVDIMGADVYHFPGQDEYFNTCMKNMLTFATTAAKEHGKLAALTETGSEACTLPNWYMDLLYPAIKDYPIVYVSVWRNAMPEMKENHFYTPYKGHPSEPDFINFYKLPKTAFLHDIQ